MLAGYAAAGGAHQFVSAFRLGRFFPIVYSADLFLSLAAFTAAMGGSFVLNQLCDIHSDKINNKLFLLGEGFVSIRRGYMESAVLLVLSIAVAVFVNVGVLAAVALFSLITGYIYNFEPFACKNRPIGGLFANLTMGWLAFIIGWLAAAPASKYMLIVSLPYLFFNLSLYFLTTLPDTTGDATSGKMTFPVKYGKNKTINLCLFFFLLAFIISLWHKNEFMLVVSFLTVPFMLRLHRKKDVPSAVIAVKAGISFFALAVCLNFPAFIVLMAVIFFFTRYYYKNRFGYDYPNFRGR